MASADPSNGSANSGTLAAGSLPAGGTGPSSGRIRTVPCHSMAAATLTAPAANAAAIGRVRLVRKVHRDDQRGQPDERQCRAGPAPQQRRPVPDRVHPGDRDGRGGRAAEAGAR